MKTPPLLPGDSIGVMAPSSYIEREDIEKSTALLEKLGYTIFIHPQTYARHNQSAGTHQEKLNALHELWANPEIKTIWSAGGGNRSLHLIDSFNYSLIKANPKPFIGFSDTTALLNAIYAHTGLNTFHGPVFKQLHNHKDLDKILNLLAEKTSAFEMPMDKATVLSEGTGHGPLIGGNLSLFQYLPQTLPGTFWKDSILFLEDCNEELSHIDRMLLHLKRIGVLNELSGLIFGEFSNLKDTGKPFGFNLFEIITEHTKGLGIPIIAKAPFGHKEDLIPLPIGAQATLNTNTQNLKLSSTKNTQQKKTKNAISLILQ